MISSNLITEEDAKNCGGDVRTDTYLDDKRYVGIKDHGPIPEGGWGVRSAQKT
jgi:hypothetical protein